MRKILAVMVMFLMLGASHAVAADYVLKSGAVIFRGELILVTFEMYQASDPAAGKEYFEEQWGEGNIAMTDSDVVVEILGSSTFSKEGAVEIKEKGGTGTAWTWKSFLVRMDEGV